MKKTIYTLIVLAFISWSAKATVRTVSNNPNSPGQYTNLQTCINAAAAGDSIYVSGSSIYYGNITINKQLALFGTGSNPQKQFPFVSSLGTITFDTVPFVSNASNTIIEGFTINDVISSNGTFTNNIHIKRNYLTSVSFIVVGGSNWIIEGNIITSGGSILLYNYANNLVIRNNIISGTITDSNQPSLVITNNLFYDSGSQAFAGISNAIISNNIFFQKTPGGTVSCSTCTFNNNLTYLTTQNVLPYGSNIGSGNITNLNPLFTVLSAFPFSYADDYRLQISSPGHNAGTDGTDIGPFGGAYPIPSSPIGGEPNIPQVKTMNIANTIIPVNGTLNVSVKGKKQD